MGLVIAIYALLYLITFNYLENRTVFSYQYHVIDTVFDSYIPFCEYFIVPYLLWFPYMIMTIWYFIFKNNNKKEYYQLIFNLMMGMTIFLIVSYVYPNVLHLRPHEFPRDNIFTDLVKFIYRTDTPTNVLPSIHVFNSLAIHMSLSNCQSLKDRKGVRIGSLTLTILIIMSTMFFEAAFCNRCVPWFHSCAFRISVFLSAKDYCTCTQESCFESISKEKHRKF